MLKKVGIVIKSPICSNLLQNNSVLSCINDRPAHALMTIVRCLSSELVSVGQENVKPQEKVSKAMKAYLERAQQHDEFMKQQKVEFQIGKRHLANMMGVDADTMNQDDIDRAIAYLFPSGLFDAKARPSMRPPEQVFPQRKAAEFDETGRPHHYLFYTMNPNFYQLLNDAVSNLEQLDKEEDQIIRKRGALDQDLKLDVSGSEWLNKDLLEKMMLEKIFDPQYVQFQSVMQRLLDHPLSNKAKDFIMKHRKLLISQTKTQQVPKPLYDAEGRAYITVKECLRKSARAEVTVRMPGTGQFTINGKDVTYFDSIQCREQKKKIHIEGYKAFRYFCNRCCAY